MPLRSIRRVAGIGPPLGFGRQPGAMCPNIYNLKVNPARDRKVRVSDQSVIFLSTGLVTSNAFCGGRRTNVTRPQLITRQMRNTWRRSCGMEESDTLAQACRCEGCEAVSALKRRAERSTMRVIRGEVALNLVNCHPIQRTRGQARSARRVIRTEIW